MAVIVTAWTARGKAAPQRITARPASAAGRPEVWLRQVLILAWLAVAAAVVVLGGYSSELGDLERRLAQGEVKSVVVVGRGLGDDQGYVTQEVRWRHHLLPREATVVVRSQTTPSDLAPDDADRETGRITGTELGSYLTERYQDLSVQRAAERSTATVFGWVVPAWLGVAFAAVQLVTLGLLVRGRERWRATSWAWFWLWLTPVGAPAFLLLGGPGGPVGPPRNPNRRLTGGWAFLLSLPLGQSWFWTE